MVGIVILNYNNSEQTLACLETLYEHCRNGNYKVCVVDNASRPEELAKLRLGCREHIVFASSNDGYACGNNLGCKWFDGDDDIDKILILNDDTRFTQDIITPMEQYLDGHPDCGVVFPLVLAPDKKTDKACARRAKSTRDLVLQATSLGKFGFRSGEFIDTAGLEERSEVVTEVPPGSCMMLPKKVFKATGWLDPHTFLYFEEHILGGKLKLAGLKCVLLAKISIIHLGASTTKKQPSKTVYRHWRDSYLYYMRNFSSVPRPLQALLRFRTWIKTLL